MSLRALILQHEEPTPPGHVTDWLAEHDATVDVLRIDIDQLKSSGMSLMPEGMEKQIDPAAMADLLEYLRVAD